MEGQEGDEIMFEGLPNLGPVRQGHTIRIIQQKDGKWLCQCLTCSYSQLEDEEVSAWKDKGYHFGRLSTVSEPYGTFAFENVPASVEM